MRPLISLTLLLTLVGAAELRADTFEKTPIEPTLGVDALTRRVAQEQLGRAVFANPYATVTLGFVDVYDVFPYLETRHFQVVSDPKWDRLVFGEVGKSMHAFSGAGTSLGPLAEPRGMAVDERHRIYLADTGNNRVVVLQAMTEFDQIELVPVFEVRDLGGPYDVAVSDAGTPFDAGDDLLYVAETGKNRVSVHALEAAGARRLADLGELGSQTGRFAGPMAIAVGRHHGTGADEVYVADAHNQRLVHLRHAGGGLTWIGEQRHDADVVTSLDADAWGNLYAAAPNRGTVYKLNPDLAPVAALVGEGSRPRSFHVPFLTVRDHRSGTTQRVGQDRGVLVEQWSDASGVALWRLGVEVADLAVVDDNGPVSRFTLTDRASVSFEVKDAASGRTLSNRSLGTLDAGLHAIPLDATELASAGGERRLRVTARSGYENGPSDVSETSFTVSGNGVLPPGTAMLLGNTPNPAVHFTRIAFQLPSTSEPVSLQILDVRGRLVRDLGSSFAPGFNEVEWDARDNGGHAVAAGVYFYRLRVGTLSFARRMVFVR